MYYWQCLKKIDTHNSEKGALKCTKMPDIECPEDLIRISICLNPRPQDHMCTGSGNGAAVS